MFRTVAFVLVALVCLNLTTTAEEPSSPAPGTLIVHLGATDGRLESELAKSGASPVHAMSADPEQRFVYIADGSNERIAILDRKSLEEVGYIGGPGRKAGEFFHLHSLDVDPQGNIVTGESQGYRVQKFIYKGLSK